MNKEYYNDLFGGKKYGEYMVYGLDKSESKYSDYSDLLNQIGSYYNVATFQEESEEEKTIRLAKEKAEKRNNKIDQILGE
jgi:hypothetical protein